MFCGRSVSGLGKFFYAVKGIEQRGALFGELWFDDAGGIEDGLVSLVDVVGVDPRLAASLPGKLGEYLVKLGDGVVGFWGIL